MRQQRLDSFRLYAIFFIICAHVQFFGGIDHGSPFASAAYDVITVGVRYTMPLFFVLAGYLTGGKIAREPSQALPIARSYTVRILAIFVFWCAVYALEQPQETLRSLREFPIPFIFQGSRIHLWFLTSLIMTVWAYALWPFRRNLASFLALGAALYVVGLLAGSYRVTPLGIGLNFETRNGIFFSTLFFGVGIALRDRKLPQPARGMAAAVACGGLALYCLEARYLQVGWGSAMTVHDFLLASIPYGIGMSLLALTQPDTALDRRIGPYGRYTLGIYAIHFLFLDLFKPGGTLLHPAVWQVLYPILVFGASLLASIILARTPLRRVVT